MKTYTSFATIEIDTTSPKKLLKKMEKGGIVVGSYAKEIALKVKPKKETVHLTMIKLSDWFTEYPTTTQIYERAKQEGLELCPPATGLHLRLSYNQPTSDYFRVGMEPITDSDGGPRVFNVQRIDGGERWLSTYWTRPYGRWGLAYRIVFRLRKESLSSDTMDSEKSLGSLETLNLESAIKIVKENGYKIFKEI